MLRLITDVSEVPHVGGAKHLWNVGKSISDYTTNNSYKAAIFILVISYQIVSNSVGRFLRRRQTTYFKALEHFIKPSRDLVGSFCRQSRQSNAGTAKSALGLGFNTSVRSNTTLSVLRLQISEEESVRGTRERKNICNAASVTSEIASLLPNPVASYKNCIIT